MNRREFIKLLIMGGSGVILHKTLACKPSSSLAGSRILPSPQVNTFSSEIVLNSRLSYHDGYSGTLSEQILSNVLWATARAPVLGSSRIIYVALPDNVYQYDPDLHEIFVHETGNHLSEPNLAFEVGVAGDVIEDSGTALHYGHLAAISFWTNTSDQPSCCPKESGMFNANGSWNPALSVHNVNSYGHMGAVSGITDELVAISSNGSLPDPSTDGIVLLENALANLNYGDQFLSTELTLNQISQLAWASYGCSPHYVSFSRAGLTVASAMANYYFTGRIYMVRAEGVERYHNRLPSGQLTTRDHRIERVTDGDQRSQLRAAIPRLPQTAPNYFVYCGSDVERWQLIEAGYCVASALLQASSIDIQGYLTADFNSSEQTAITNALSIPASDLPLAIFSTGHADVGIGEKSGSNIIYFEASPNPFKDKTRIRYSLASPAQVKLTIYDSIGRRVNILVDHKKPKGNFSVTWNGTNREGKNLPNGTYYYILKTGLNEYKRKVIKTRI
ncbi:gliding motility-associated C-terminal domain-containing protein [bacterium]|nr:gliding motility-associated C-terminal domain-containing protein [bacterium]